MYDQWKAYLEEEMNILESIFVSAKRNKNNVIFTRTNGVSRENTVERLLL